MKALWANRVLLGLLAGLLVFAVTAPAIAGSGFLLGGNAQNAQDPENPANDVIRIDTLTPPLYGTVSRTLNVKLAALDNMLEFKSYFQNRSCGGGSPRIQLAVDLNGDGIVDGNLHGHWPGPPFYLNCPANTWYYNDLTDGLPRWEIGSGLVAAGFPALSCPSPNPVVNALCMPTPFPVHSGYAPWPILETVMTTLFPNHKICSGALVDDSGWLAGAAGVAFYDLISIGRATWVNREDSVGRGSAQGCGKPDHDDGEVDGDENHDHDFNDEDHDWKSKHRHDN